MASTPDAHRVRNNRPSGSDLSPASISDSGTPHGPNSHQLDFYQAMVDFKVMFPNMDEEIIEAVLRANNGGVDATIDQLLTMNVDTSPEANPDPTDSPRGMAQEPPGYQAVMGAVGGGRNQHSSRVESTDSESDDPPPYLPPSYQSYTAEPEYANTELLGATASPPPPDPNPVVDPSYSYSAKANSFSLKTTQSTTVAAASSTSPKIVTTTSQQSPFNLMMDDDTAASNSQTQGASGTSNDLLQDLFTPAPAFDPFDDDFFRTPAAPKAVVPHASPSTHDYINETPSTQLESPKQRLYLHSKWNPPMLGDLPDDFLRIMEDVPVSSSKNNLSPRDRGDIERVGRGEGSARKKGRHHHHHRREHKKSGSEDASPGQKQHSSEGSRLNSMMLQVKLAENRRQHSLVAGNDVETAQFLDDEMLALYLQNEEFLNDLRQNTEFMDALEKERMNATAFEPADDVEQELSKSRRVRGESQGDNESSNPPALPKDKEVAPSSEENAELRRQLKHMGGSSKKKLATLARKFFTRNKKKEKYSKRDIGAGGTLGPSTRNLLEDEDAPELRAMGNLREDSESNLNGSRGGAVANVPSHRTFQRPPYHPDGIVTYDHTDPNLMC